MARKTAQTKRREGAKVLPSRRQVRSAIDSGVKSLRDGLLAADTEVRKQVAAIADRFAAPSPAEVRKRVAALVDRLAGQPVEVLQALATELQARLEKLREAIPTTPAQQERVRERVAKKIDGLRRRARSAAAGRRGTARAPR